jgi:hypothetical protein
LAMHLRKSGFNSKIEFIVGSDTMRRIMEAYGVTIDPSVPYNEATYDLSDKSIAALKPFMGIDVEFKVVSRKNRDGKSYEYFVPMTKDAQLQLSNVNYIEIDTDFPSSTELRKDRKDDDCAFAINAYNAYYQSGMMKSFKEFVSDFHDSEGAKRYHR